MSIHAVVLGGAGYVGGELLRLLHAHPVFELAAAVSTTYANKPVADVFPHLAHAYEGIEFVSPDDWSNGIPAGSDVALYQVCTPTGATCTMRAGCSTTYSGSGTDPDSPTRSATSRGTQNVWRNGCCAAIIERLTG